MGYFRNVARAMLAPVFRALIPYEGASQGRRLAHFQATDEDINSILLGASDTLRARCRHIARTDPWAINAVESKVANLVSTGIKPQFQHPNPKVKFGMQEAWLRWTDEADFDGITDFYGLQALAVRSMIEGGECFIRLRYPRKDEGHFIPFQLQVLEAEHLQTNHTEDRENGNRIRAGIEFDRRGRRAAYHLTKVHPGAGTTAFNFTRDTQRVPANEVIHLFHRKRPGQMRGEPWLTPILTKIYNLGTYDDAELERKKVAALFAGFVTSPAKESDPPLPGTATTLGDATAPAGVEYGGMEPGTMQYLSPGEDIKFSDPAEVGGQYESFMRVQLRAAAAGFGVTYEQMTSDLTGVNYSSIRAGKLEFQRRAEQTQHQVIVFQMCRTILAEWVTQAILADAFNAPRYEGNQYLYTRVKWIAPGWAWVDPLKDITAQRLAVRSGFTSRRMVVSATGEDVEVIDQEQALDNERADKFNLAYDSDGRQAVDNGPEAIKNIKGKPNDEPQDNDMPEDIEPTTAEIDQVVNEIRAELQETAAELRAEQRQEPPPPPQINVTTPPVTVTVATAGKRTQVIHRDAEGRISHVETLEE